MCKSSFRRCKMYQDQAMSYVSKCKTSLTGVKEQYKQLLVISDSVDKVLDKIASVIEGSLSAVPFPAPGRSTLIIVTCVAFTNDITIFTAMVQVIQGTRLGRSLSEILDLVAIILSSTIFPPCDEGGITSLTVAQATAVSIQTVVSAQVAQVQAIIGHAQVSLCAS